MESARRFDTAVIERAAEPASDFMCSSFGRGSCMDLAIIAIRASSAIGVFYVALTAIGLGDGEQAATLTFCFVMMFMALRDNLAFEKAVRPFADRARRGEVSWALPPFRALLFRARMIEWACIAASIVFIAWMLVDEETVRSSVAPATWLSLALAVAFFVSRQTAQYFAACRPRPPMARGRSFVWSRGSAPAGA